MRIPDIESSQVLAVARDAAAWMAPVCAADELWARQLSWFTGELRDLERASADQVLGLVGWQVWAADERRQAVAMRLLTEVLRRMLDDLAEGRPVDADRAGAAACRSRGLMLRVNPALAAAVAAARPQALDPRTFRSSIPA